MASFLHNFEIFYLLYYLILLYYYFLILLNLLFDYTLLRAHSLTSVVCHNYLYPLIIFLALVDFCNPLCETFYINITYILFGLIPLLILVDGLILINPLPAKLENPCETIGLGSSNEDVIA